MQAHWVKSDQYSLIEHSNIPLCGIKQLAKYVQIEHSEYIKIQLRSKVNHCLCIENTLLHSCNKVFVAMLLILDCNKSYEEHSFAQKFDQN